MTNRQQPEKIPPLILEKLAQNQLSSSDKEYLNTYWSEDTQKSALSEIQKSNRNILAKFPTDSVASNIELRLKANGQVRPLHRRSWSVIAGIAASLILFFAWQNQNAKYPEGDILLKGSVPHIAVYRKLASGFERLKTGAIAHNGETMQLRYFAAGYSYGAILSIDGDGKITQHLPAEAKESDALKQGAEIALPFAYELDDAPLFERFIFVVSHKPFAVQPLHASLHSLHLQGNSDSGVLQLPPDSILYSFIIRKK